MTDKKAEGERRVSESVYNYSCLHGLWLGINRFGRKTAVKVKQASKCFRPPKPPAPSEKAARNARPGLSSSTRRGNRIKKYRALKDTDMVDCSKVTTVESENTETTMLEVDIRDRRVGSLKSVNSSDMHTIELED